MTTLTKSLIILFALFSSTLASGSVTTGIANIIDGGDLNPGFSLGASFYGNTSNVIGVGGKLGFNRWAISEDYYGSKLTISANYLEIAPLIRLQAKINETATFFFESTSGLFLAIAAARYNGESDSDSEGKFGLSFSPGFDINKITLKPEFKMVFWDGDTDNFFTFNAGFNF